MADLEDGATIEMKGSGAKPYIIKNVGGVYSCTCPAWRNQSLQPYQRTCKHIRKLRGDAAEEERLGAAALTAPVRKAASEAKEGPPVLLAESWDTQSDVLGWWMSEKLDGGAGVLGRQAVHLASGKHLFGPRLLPERLARRSARRRAVDRAENVHQDHERHSPARQASRLERRSLRRLRCPDSRRTVRGCMGYLEDLLSRHRCEFVHRLEHEVCRGADHLLAELDRVSELGAEGLMLRQPGSLDEAARSTTLLKVKRFHDAEARVIGYVAGAGKHKGRAGSLEVEMDGVRFAIGTGLSDAERNNPPPIGTVVTFRYQELSENRRPAPSFLRRHPRGWTHDPCPQNASGWSGGRAERQSRRSRRSRRRSRLRRLAPSTTAAGRTCACGRSPSRDARFACILARRRHRKARRKPATPPRRPSGWRTN